MTDHTFDFDLVVVGAGPAGLAAACVAAESGCRTAVLDETPWLGGQIWRGQEAHPSSPEAQRCLARFRSSGASLLSGASVVAAPLPGLLLAEHNQQPCQVRYHRLVLATGARELFLPFPGWTLPGVVGPGGLLALAKHGWPVSGRRIVVGGSGPLLLAVAEGLRPQGARVLSISEQASWHRIMGFGLTLASFPAKLCQAAQMRLRLLGVPYRCGVWPLRADGEEQLRQVTLTDGRRAWSEECDLFACGFGLVPNVELPLALGCELQSGFVRVDSSQATSVPNVYCAGEPTGIGGADCAQVEGRIAGYAAAGQTSKAEALFAQRAAWHRFRAALATAFALRPELKTLAADDTVLCRCEDVSLGQIRRFANWRDAKLQSRCGMGTCQGRVCGAAARAILGWDMESVRPPVLPALVRSLISQSQSEPPPAAAAEPSPETQPVENGLCAASSTNH
jgi:NADPH-dependent 2,4-dienoyl-CoA reductase/sulfur reductase-like enzyme